MEEVLRNQESQGQGETLNFGVMSFSPNFSRIKPTAQDLRMRFGLDSPTYSIAISELKKLWEAVKDEPDVQRKQELWASSMEVVYGSKPDIKTFIDHTYLATLAKLVVFLMLNGDNAVDQDVLKTVLTDEYFAKHGISNLTEGDFFTWIAHPKILHKALALFYGIIQGLALYDLTQINEDFFKELYQDIVERGTRHKRGEYYTPEWLAELLLRDAIEEWRRRGGKGFPSILDPACGSGTFLVNAIFKAKEELKREGKTPEQILDFILNNIVGTDINPLAAVIARANYLLALGDLLRHRNGSIVIPIYVTDALRQSPITDLLSHKFDVVIGNPPWLTMHDVNSKEYQDFLKKLALEYELLSTKEPHLFSQIEMATLFFDRAADIYLKDNGVIAFVMPKSVLTGAMQHIKFKEFKKPLMQLLKVYDFADVKPLFNVHSIALMAVKGGETHYPSPWTYTGVD
jgi:type I restriction-modification system DNA methylase subunit